jgi:hypothetical protein
MTTLQDISALTQPHLPGDWSEIDSTAVDTVRVLAADAVQNVGNGHPGTAMSLAPLAYTLFQRVMRHDPSDTHWLGRDRFVLSCGHSSLTLYLQQVGRGLRVCPGKPHAVVLDHVGNSHRHGLPTDDRAWSLEGRVGRKTGEQAPSVRVCPKCFCCLPSGKPRCGECGHEFTPERRELQHVDGELVEVSADQLKRETRREQGEARTVEDLVQIGKRRGMKNPTAWARHVMAARQNRSHAAVRR